MSNYPTLQHAVAQNNPDEIKGLLSTIPIDDRVELFNIAIQKEDFLVVDTLLQWDPELKDHLISLTDVVAIKNYPLDILAMLVDYGADLNQTVGETTLLGMIQQRDQDVALFLEDETKNLQQLHQIFNTDIIKQAKPQLTDPRDQFIRFVVEFFVKTIRSAKVCNTMSIYMALVGYGPLEEQTKLALTLAQKGDPYLDPENLTLLNEEINFAYSLYYEFPYYSQHADNFIIRLKKLCLSFKATLAPGIESPLIQELEIMTNEYDHKALQTASAQSWLIKPTEAIKEQADVQLENSGGQCFGFSYMTKQAMDADELIPCKKRIEWMQSIPIEQLKDILQKNREHMLANHQQGIEPSETQLEHLELEGYIQGTAFAQKPSIPPITDFTNQILNLSAILMSKKLEAKGGLVQIQHMKYYYDHASLLTYFHTLREVIDATSPPCGFVSFFLSCPTHIIVVGYDVKQCKWVFCDANAAPQIQYINSDWLLAAKVIFALSIGAQNTISQIETGVYGTKDQEQILCFIFEQPEIHPQLVTVHNTQRQQSLQAMMPFFSAKNDSIGLAIASGNLTLVHFALKGIDINAELISGKTPLITAIEGEDITMVKFLIKAGADVNHNESIIKTAADPKVEISHSTQHLSLTATTNNKTADIMNLLLNSGVQCNPEQITFLLSTILYGERLEHFKGLLKNAGPGVKENLLKASNIFYQIRTLPIECRSDYIICDEIRAYLLGWIENFYLLEDLLDKLPLEKRSSFLQQSPDNTLSAWIKDSRQLRALIKLLPKNEVESFLQRFLEQLFAGDVQLWFKHRSGLSDLCEIIKLSPEQVAPFLQRFFNQHFEDGAQKWTLNVYDLHKITDYLPPKERYFFLQQKNIHNLLMQCGDNAYYLGQIITLLAEEHVLLFLQQDLSPDVLETCISFRLPEIVRSLPKQELIPFFQQKIVQDKLVHYMSPDRSGDKNDITDIINGLPHELIDWFFEQHQESIQKWTINPTNLRSMLLVLPPEKICPLIAQHVKTSPNYLEHDVNLLLKHFNNQHQDIVVECFIHIPELLQAIDNKEKVYQIIGDSYSNIYQNRTNIDQNIFIENLVRIIQLQEKTSENVSARFKPYEDIKAPWLYDNLVRVYQRNQKTIQDAIRSDLRPHTFFTNDQDNQSMSIPIQPDLLILKQ